MLLSAHLEVLALRSSATTRHWTRFGIFSMFEGACKPAHLLPRIPVHQDSWTHENLMGLLLPPSDGSKSDCPATGIKYLPKASGSTPTPSSTPTPPSPPSGKGTLPVTTGGVQKGCVISGGTWYTTGTCATFAATPSGSYSTKIFPYGRCILIFPQDQGSPSHRARANAPLSVTSSRALPQSLHSPFLQYVRFPFSTHTSHPYLSIRCDSCRLTLPIDCKWISRIQ